MVDPAQGAAGRRRSEGTHHPALGRQHHGARRRAPRPSRSRVRERNPCRDPRVHLGPAAGRLRADDLGRVGPGSADHRGRPAVGRHGSVHGGEPRRDDRDRQRSGAAAARRPPPRPDRSPRPPAGLLALGCGRRPPHRPADDRGHRATTRSDAVCRRRGATAPTSSRGSDPSPQEASWAWWTVTSIAGPGTLSSLTATTRAVAGGWFGSGPTAAGLRLTNDSDTMVSLRPCPDLLVSSVSTDPSANVTLRGPLACGRAPASLRPGD